MVLPQRTYFTPDLPDPSCPLWPLAPWGPLAPVFPTGPWSPLGPGGPGNGLLVPGFPCSPIKKWCWSLGFLNGIICLSDFGWLSSRSEFLTSAKQSALSTHFCLGFHFLKGRIWKGCYCIAVGDKFIFNYWGYFYFIFKIGYFIVCLWGLMVQAIQLVQVIQEGQVVQLSPCLYFDHAVLE